MSASINFLDQNFSANDVDIMVSELSVLFNSPSPTRKLKSYKKASISAQIFSAIKSNEQLLTDSQCNGYDYVGIN